MNKSTSLKRNDIFYPQESYKIVGILFCVYNELGSGHPEKYYQRAIAKELSEQRIKFCEQVYTPLRYRGGIVGKQFLDFLIDDKIVLEIKRGEHFSKKHIDQVLEYMRTSNYRLAILANFGSEGVLFRRLINFKES